MWFGRNYGSALTYYALHETLRSLGKSVLMIDKPFFVTGDREVEDSRFRRFSEKHYHISERYPVGEFYRYNELCRDYIVGSDQTFNRGVNKPFGYTYYLDFAPDTARKIAYAASIGHDRDFAGPSERVEIGNLLQRFQAVSLREDTGAEYISGTYGVKAVQMPDPVFLLPAAAYEQLIEEKNIEDVHEPFIATYILDPTPAKREMILESARQLGVNRVINMLNGLPWEYDRAKDILALPDCPADLGVEDWLYLIHNAEYVITDSCHGASFSLLFGTPFTLIGNKARGIDRMESLVRLFGMEERLVRDEADSLRKAAEEVTRIAAAASAVSIEANLPDRQTQRILERESAAGIRFLQEALEAPIGKDSLHRSHICAVTEQLDPSMCMGCSACEQTCPAGALRIEPDELGYYRPVLDTEKCINCAKCSFVCPALQEVPKTNADDPDTYAVIAEDREILNASSSGGIFTLLAEQVLQEGGAVAGCAWDDDLTARHIIIESIYDLPLLQKSKYMQSRMENVYSGTKKLLQEGRTVLFTGCPCQIAGLYSYLGCMPDSAPENLITADLLCGNAPSAGFFTKYLRETFPDGVESYEFRNKVRGIWWNHTAAATFPDGSVTYCKRESDPYQQAYHPHMMIAPHCEACHYQEVPRYGDLTIGDFWGYERRHPEMDLTKGVSAVLVNNAKGKKLFDSIPEERFALKKQEAFSMIGGNGSAAKGSHNWASPYRDRFYEAMRMAANGSGDMTFKEAIEYAKSPALLTRYSGVTELGPAAFDTSYHHFLLEPGEWSETEQNGKLCLIPVEEHSPICRFASLPLRYSLQRGVPYRLTMRFKVRSEEEVLNLHIKQAGKPHFQLINSYQIRPEDAAAFREITFDFVPDDEVYSEFMIVADHVTGADRYFILDYLYMDRADGRPSDFVMTFAEETAKLGRRVARMLRGED